MSRGQGWHLILCKAQDSCATELQANVPGAPAGKLPHSWGLCLWDSEDLEETLPQGTRAQCHQSSAAAPPPPSATVPPLVSGAYVEPVRCCTFDPQHINSLLETSLVSTITSLHSRTLGLGNSPKPLISGHGTQLQGRLALVGIRHCALPSAQARSGQDIHVLARDMLSTGWHPAAQRSSKLPSKCLG